MIKPIAYFVIMILLSTLFSFISYEKGYQKSKTECTTALIWMQKEHDRSMQECLDLAEKLSVQD